MSMRHGELIYVQIDNELIGLNRKYGIVSAANHVFDKMLERTLDSWNFMLSGFASNG